jgi:nucleoid-associated protein YgaU
MTTPDKPDFSNVKGSVSSTEQARADFSNVQSSVTSTEQKIGGSGSGSVGEQSYTVVKGDTLSHIAKHFYGKASRWHAIYDANRDQLDDPDRIFPGQVLKIPAHND